MNSEHNKRLCGCFAWGRDGGQEGRSELMFSVAHEVESTTNSFALCHANYRILQAYHHLLVFSIILLY